MNTYIKNLGPAAENRRQEIKEVAWSIAEASGTVPAKCHDPICREFWFLCQVACTIAKDHGDQAIVVNNDYAYHLQKHDPAKGGFEGWAEIGPMLTRDAVDAWIEDSLLCIEYASGIIEYHEFIQAAEAWSYIGNNLSIDEKQLVSGLN
jgi:hypothetical protein